MKNDTLNDLIRLKIEDALVKESLQNENVTDVLTVTVISNEITTRNQKDEKLTEFYLTNNEERSNSTLMRNRRLVNFLFNF